MNKLLNFGCNRAILLLSSTFFVVALTSILCISASKAKHPIRENEAIEKLPFCGNSGQRDISRRLLYVSTLDGGVTALDIQNNGELKWSLKTNPGELLSSSIHRLELTNNGQWVRMIPSLHGGLYKFDGQTIEQIPVTADHLLSSSFKFSDDLVISGGKETRSYGISSRTGQILYECSSAGCKNGTGLDDEEVNHGGPRAYKIEEETHHDPLTDDIIVVRRQTQTVRAVEPRTGGERWNFSVGHHELEILRASDCHGQMPNEKQNSWLDLDLKVIVPEGIVCAVRKETPTEIVWQHKFDHPIVNAWKTNEIDELESVDLFSYLQWPINSNIEKPPNFNDLSPAVYVGMFNKQLYIQESEKLKKIVLNQYLDSINRDYLKIPWNPYPATSSALALIEVDSTTKQETTAISILNGTEYVNGNGFYLYSTEDPEIDDGGLCDKENSTGDNIVVDDEENYGFPFADDDTPAKIIIVSLWFWWKEIMVISLTTALILNVVLSRRLTSSREVVIVERHVEIKVPIAAEPVVDEIVTRRSISESTNGDFFVSRFQGDFDMVQCLGKGGFGVVFESKNKLDDCKYAIKRIMLPNRQESRERVMREVKTLAHCEHQNIVRYFQAWVETPPPGWQEKEDRIWMDREALSHSIDIDSPTEISAPPNKVFSEVINGNNKELDSWISNLQTNECINFDDNIRKTTFIADDDDDDDDSFIQFKDDTAQSGNDSVFLGNHEISIHRDDDDSFDIEFKEPTSDGIVNGDDTAPSRKSCSKNASFQIVFQNSTTNNNNEQSITNDDSFRIQFKENIPNGRSKQRTFSECVPYINGFTIPTETDCNNSTASNNKNIVEIPFKKTHRRPMSLDLTSRRKIDLFLPPSRMYLYIQMQLCKKQSLKDWLRLNDLATRQCDIVPIFKQIVDGVEYCHLKGLIHRDLKPSNIFFSLDGQIKIGDFGLVTDMSDIPNTPCGDVSGLPAYVKHTEQVGTHLYMSPEQLQGRQYNYKVDIYSLGLIFFELLVVFVTEMERIETLKALRMSIFPQEFAHRFMDEYKLLKIMLSQSPKERPTTIGIRARPPLGYTNSNTLISEEWHFELPPRRRDSHISGLSSNSSITEILKFK